MKTFTSLNCKHLLFQLFKFIHIRIAYAFHSWTICTRLLERWTINFYWIIWTFYLIFVFCIIMPIQSSRCHFHCSLPFVVTFVLFMLSLHSILLQSHELRHNQSSTTTPLPSVNTVIFKSYLCHFFWSHLTKNLAASILNFCFLFLILLSGDIHLNPGPTSKFNICTLNIRSLTNQLHYTALADLALTTSTYLLFLKLGSLPPLPSPNFLKQRLLNSLSSAPLALFLKPIKRKKLLEVALLFWFIILLPLSQLLLRSSNHLNSPPLQ